MKNLNQTISQPNITSIPQAKLKTTEENNPKIKQSELLGEEKDTNSSCEPEVLHIGELKDNSEKPALLEVKPLNRHIAIIGSPGSGKTVLAKVIVEELLLHSNPGQRIILSESIAASRNSSDAGIVSKSKNNFI